MLRRAAARESLAPAAASRGCARGSPRCATSTATGIRRAMCSAFSRFAHRPDARLGIAAGQATAIRSSARR